MPKIFFVLIALWWLPQQSAPAPLIWFGYYTLLMLAIDLVLKSIETWHNIQAKLARIEAREKQEMAARHEKENC